MGRRRDTPPGPQTIACLPLLLPPPPPALSLPATEQACVPWEGRQRPNTSTSELRNWVGRGLQHMRKHREIIAALAVGEGRGGAGRRWLFTKPLPICHQEFFQLLPTAAPRGRGNSFFSAEGRRRRGEAETGGPRRTATKREKEFGPRSTCLRMPFPHPDLTPQNSPFPAGSFLQEVVLFSGGLAGSDG